MITCEECIERMRPDDPRVKSGRYHLSGCDYCDKPDYYRGIGNIKLDVPQEVPWVKQQWNTVKQMRAMILFLQGKLDKHLDTKKLKEKSTYTIK